MQYFLIFLALNIYALFKAPHQKQKNVNNIAVTKRQKNIY